MWNPWSKREQRKPSVIPREVIDCLDHPGQWTQAMERSHHQRGGQKLLLVGDPDPAGHRQADALGALVIVGNYLYHNPGS